ncbi:MFS transporter [Campylobacter sp. MG1]|uniref:MFS transporter n=1 Tax=Campylobacter sp. MG1 TaxID=2976332 RepID=UPI00226D1E06|nr:MFS transporter [Campylobacter sp. MG1]
MRKQYFLISIFCVIFISLNLRAPITMIGGVSNDIINHFNLNDINYGILNALPLFCFFIFSLLSPIIPKNKSIFIGLILLMIGLFLRSYFDVNLLFLGTFITGIAMAILNVLIPSFIKNNFKNNTGSIMALYSMFLTISGLIGICTYKIVPFVGLNNSLFIWIIFAIIGLICYVPFLKNGRFFRKFKNSNIKDYIKMFKNKNAWYITAFMGLQCCLYYTIVAWYPIFLMQNMSKLYANNALVIFQITAIISGYFLPFIITKIKFKATFLFISFFLNIIASIFMIFSSNFYILISLAILFAIPCGGATGVILVMIAQKSKNIQNTIYITSMSQGFGYFLASLGPVIFGFLKNIFNNFLFSSIFVLILSILLLIFTLLSNKIKEI